ncbi:carbon-phosphorus lyase complex subunit PhnI, partial [bacterium]|nr:carbon-phosphorus lyase complex subunit PhnI [bacterium]
MYVAVKGGESAILNSYDLLAQQRRGDPAVEELSVDQIRQQLRLAVDRVMTEGSVYDPQLAALAIKQSAGDLVEAIFLLRAAGMQIARRISAAFKDLPGGQVLGPTYDYTQRLLDFSLLATGAKAPVARQAQASTEATPRVVDLLHHESLLETQPAPSGDPDPFDLTRQPVRFPADRSARLQNLARADEGFLLAMAYST